mmetsp:Transcript_25524/g.33229  ORF Transcript_25524/g.33229 Transcript_25524/m.33229 type:complete len:205 (+) Transcript_25524:49-663(+)
MTSVNELYPRVHKLKYDLQQQLREVEAHRMSPYDLQLGLDALNMQASQLESFADREINRKEEWKAKIKDIRESHGWMVEQLSRWRYHNDREAVEEAERNELFNRTKMPSSIIGALDDESQSLNRSANVMSNLIDTAGASFAELVAQRERMKGTQRKVLDMLTTLGVSSSTIRVIERRNVIDRVIVFGGMIVTLIFLFFLWRWVR